MKKLWLHIGVPKSGTASIQRFLSNNLDMLASSGLSYVSPDKRSSSSRMAVAANRQRTNEIKAFATEICTALTENSGTGVTSSEVFFPVRTQYALWTA